MIKKLIVKNFKSLKDFECDFSEISVLAGPNMSGKSNIIDALAFITESVNIGYIAAIQNRNGYWEIKWKGKKTQEINDYAQPEPISFFIEGDIYLQKYRKNFDFTYLFELSADNYGNPFIQKEELNIGGQAIIEASQNKARYKQGLEETEQFKEINLMNQLTLQTVNISNGISFDVRLFFFRIANSFYTLEPSSMKNTQNISSFQQFLFRNGSNLSSWLLTLQTKYPENFAMLINAIRNILPDVKNIFANITKSTTVYLSSKENNIDGDINLFNMSDGEIKLIGLLSLIFAPPELTPPFIAVEEPENYLHPGILKDIIEMLRSVRRNYKKQIEGNAGITLELAQVLITTHSLVLIDNFYIEELIIVKKEQGGTIVIYPKDDDDMKKLIEDKEMGLGSLYFSGALK